MGRGSWRYKQRLLAVGQNKVGPGLQYMSRDPHVACRNGKSLRFQERRYSGVAVRCRWVIAPA